MLMLLFVMSLMISSTAQSAKRLPIARALTTARKEAVCIKLIENNQLGDLRIFLEYPSNVYMEVPDSVALVNFIMPKPSTICAAIAACCALGLSFFQSRKAEYALDVTLFASAGMGYTLAIKQPTLWWTRDIVRIHEHNAHVHDKYTAKKLALAAQQGYADRMRRMRCEETRSSLSHMPTPVANLVIQYYNNPEDYLDDAD